MPTEFLLASVGAGKTEAAQARLLALKQRDPFALTWCLLATERQIHAFRHRLMNRSDGQAVHFNVEFFTFYPLYRHILETAGKPQRVLDNAARYRLLRIILTDLENSHELELFGKIAGTPGLVRMVADFIYELKQNLVDHNRFGEQAETAKDRDIGRIYTRYQELLRRYDLVDREGEGWRALDELEDNHGLASDVKLMLVDGYDQFNKLQGQLLTLIASRAEDTLITLTTVPERETTIGKRFERALDHLIAYHREERVVFHRRPLVQASSRRDAALVRLVERIFQPGHIPLPSGSAVQLFEAPNPAGEVAAVLRHAKRLLLAGANPDEMLIAVRDWARYRAYFEQQAQAYKLPIMLDIGGSLLENQAIHALTRLLELHMLNFRRRELLDVLRSNYFAVPGLDAESVDLLERIGLARLVQEGREAWLAALSPAAVHIRDEDDDGSDAEAPDAAALAAVRTALAAFFDAVTPPKHASAAGYVAWLEDLIGNDPIDDADDEDSDEPEAPFTLNMVACARQPTTHDRSDHIVARDLAVLQELKRLLRAGLSAQRLFAALDMSDTPSWESFYSDLVNALATTAPPQRAGRDGRILVTTVTEARGLPHAHVMVLGLSEGIFPMRTAEDPLYLDSERRHLQSRGIDLPTQAESADDDGLFYEMLGLATQSLVLTRSTYENNAPLPPSHLWRAVQQTLTELQIDTMRLGSVVPATQAASLREVALGIADALSRRDASAAGVQAWYQQTYPDAWAQIEHARSVELRRMARTAHDRYSGRLNDRALVAEAAALFSDRQWSASQLNDFGICGFRFFAKRLLKLEDLAKPEDGLSAAQLGTVYHEILEHTYRDLAQQNTAIVPENLALGLDALERAAARLDDAPARLGLPTPALWHEARMVILRKLRAVVQADFDPDSSLNRSIQALSGGTRTPFRLETPFGERGVLALDLGGEELLVRGVIDRLDRAGERVVVIDYKTGSSEIPSSEIERGRNFQMLIYLLAARAAMDADAHGFEVTGGLFWHIGSRKASGVLQFDDEQVIEAGKAHIRAYMARGRSGDFVSHANKIENGKCSRFCEYSQLCRFSIMNRHKTHE
jgi:ATP-dependent helicase/DNAse subunit B